MVKKGNKKESLILGKMLKKIAPRIGAHVVLEPRWEIAGQIVFRSGKKSYFRYNTLDLNPVGASDIAKDKDYSNFFMKKMGYPIIPGSKTFFSHEWGNALGVDDRNIDHAYLYAQKLGFPVFVKPNSGSQGGGVALVHTKREFYRAMRAVFMKDRIALVQCPVVGKDYRVVVLDNEVISAYERLPLSVIGDGVSSVKQLLDTKQRGFDEVKRDTQIKQDDPRIATKLSRQGKTFDTVPFVNECVFLLDNANLSTGGDSVDVTNVVHSQFNEIAVRLTRDMGLRLCGVDFMISGDICEAPKKGKYFVIEINAAPGLDHYVKIGKQQEKIVEALYLKVLTKLDR